MDTQSEKFTYNLLDLKKIGRGALYAMGGALITFLIQVVPGIDFGQYNLIIAPMISILLNAAQKYLAGSTAI